MEPVLARLVGITLQNHRLHIVVQNVLWNSAEEGEGITVALPHGLVAHVVRELDIKHPVVAQHGNKDVQRSMTGAHRAPVNLYLLTGLPLEADSGFCNDRLLFCPQEVTQQGQGIPITLLPDFPVDDGRSNPVRMRVRDASADLILPGIQQRGRFCP